MNRILNTIFLVFIFAFSAMFLFGVGSEDISTIEKRQLRDVPSITNTPIAELPDAYNEYISDHFPLRRRLSKVTSLISYTLLGTVRSDSVAVGENGFLFLKSEVNTNSLSDYQGTNAFSDAELEELSESLNTLKRQCEDRGQTLIFVIVPNKEEVYSKYLPDYYRRLSSPTRLEQVTAAVKSADIILIDPSRELKAASESDDTVFFKADTHWTGKGAYICMDILLDALGISHVPYSENTFVEGEFYESDIANLCNLYDLYADNRDLKAAKQLTESPADASVSLIGDSFSWRMHEYMDACFSTVHYHTFAADSSKLQDEASDYLIIEIVERNLGEINNVIDSCMY